MSRSNCVWILLSLLGISQLTLTGGTDRWSNHQQQQPSSYPKFSSASSSYRKPSASSQQPSFDYSNGYPKGFTDGLPTFNFDGPMTAAGENKEQHEPADTENVGFVHGPPDGFPNLEQLGGKFGGSDFGGSSSRFSPASSAASSSPYSSPPPPRHPHNNHNYHESPPPPRHSSSASEPYTSSRPAYSNNNEEDSEEYLSGPGPASIENLPPNPNQHGRPRPPSPLSSHSHSQSHGHRRPSGSSSYPEYNDRANEQRPPSHYRKHGQPPPPPPGQPSPNKHRYYSNSKPQASSSSSNPRSQYPSRYSPHPQQQQYSAKKPVVLKVPGGQRAGSEAQSQNLPPGPPVFYAPSPDMQSSSQYEDNSRASSSYKDYARQPGGKVQKPTYNDSNNNHGRYKRSTDNKKKNKLISYSDHSTITANKHHDDDDVISNGDDMQTAADETYWELTSPFILFDTYKKAGPETQVHHSNSGSGGSSSSSPSGIGNISFVDKDGQTGEQRFFPSFPAPPAPYLSGPFGGGPPSHRAPLFPGPAANRAPSRYHPQYSPKFSPPAPPPNRGPSGVYSAESHHDHQHYQDNNLLGSGNFEVVRGGTYYGDDDDGYHGGGGGGHQGVYHEHDDDGYYHPNGHSSPQEGYRNPGQHGQDFFANFRDFADINPPSRAAYSHHHETMASELEPRRTASSAEILSRQPKNILEKLESATSSRTLSSRSSAVEPSDPMMATN